MTLTKTPHRGREKGRAMEEVNNRKVAIIGCGFVGSASAFALMESGLFTEMVLLDVDHARAEGEALDISHGTAFASPMEIYAGSYDVLLCTTIIESGLDVPTANTLIVFDADRFGLSQLHQLRGRVGRGTHRSYCVLMAAGRGETARQRLRTLARTRDGFAIAEEDLKLRGPGDFFGRRQHGLPALRAADLAGDMRVLQQARQAAREVLEQDPELERPENRAVRDRVRQMFSETPDIFN